MILATDLSPNMAWALGVFEGEGSIVTDNRQTKRRVTLSVMMVDRDVIQRLQTITGVGRIQGPYETGHQIVWRWSVTKAEDSLWLLELWLPYLSERRSKKAITAIEGLALTVQWKQHKTCKRGHTQDTTTVYVAPSGYKNCRLCVKDRAHNYRKRGAN